jgi:hypothetical protein
MFVLEAIKFPRTPRGIFFLLFLPKKREKKTIYGQAKGERVLVFCAQLDGGVRVDVTTLAVKNRFFHKQRFIAAVSWSLRVKKAYVGCEGT